MGEAKTRRKAYNVSAEQFVKVWQAAGSAAEAAKALNMPKDIAQSRASEYRSAGVKLKKMPRKCRLLDIDGLNKLVAEIDAEQVGKR